MQQNEWIDWAGGDAPLLDDTKVEVRLRDGSTGPGLVEGFRWWHVGGGRPGDPGGDVVAYRSREPVSADDARPAATSAALFAPYGAPVKDTNPKDAIGDKKVPLWLLSPIAKAHWALAQFAGMLKYGAWNWRPAGVRSSVYLSAIQRHADAYASGESFDPVDGTHHLGNIMACCAIVLEAEAAGNLTDDRPPSVDIRGVYHFVESAMARLRDQYAGRQPRHYTIADTEPKA